MTKTGIPVLFVCVLSIQGCWDSTVIAIERSGGGSSRDADSYISTSSEAPSDSEVLPDTEVSTATETSMDTDSGPATDMKECEGAYSSALVCTGFEDGISLMTQTNEGGSLETATTPVFDGQASLHASTEGDRQFANVSGTFDPLFENSVYFRAYYFIAAGEITGNVKLAAFEGADIEVEGDGLNVDFMVGVAGNIYIYLHEPQPVASVFQSEAGVLPVDTWFCLRGAVEISDTAGSVVFSIGDTDLVTATGLDTLPLSGVSWADFGVGWTDGVTNSVDVYVDNIVVDTSPVPCI